MTHSFSTANPRTSSCCIAWLSLYLEVLNSAPGAELLLQKALETLLSRIYQTTTRCVCLQLAAPPAARFPATMAITWCSIANQQSGFPITPWDVKSALGPILKRQILGQIRISNALSNDGYSTGNALLSGNNAWYYYAHLRCDVHNNMIIIKHKWFLINNLCWIEWLLSTPDYQHM